MESDYPQAREKTHKILDALVPLVQKQDALFKFLNKTETGWLLDTLMRYVRLDLKATELIEMDTIIIDDLQMQLEDLKFKNDKLTDQIQEMRHYD